MTTPSTPSTVIREVGDSRSARSDRVAQAALVCIFAIIATATWAKWGYLPVDSGREMYAPAELSTGKRLYQDIWYMYGPLIPYWHALLFRVFGIHLEILFAAGLCIAAGTAALLYSLSRWFLSPWLSFAVTFAFILQAFQLDLFNYILPYSYPAAYGSLGTVLLAWLLVRDFRTKQPWHLFAAGILAGLLTLSKIEVGVVAFAILGVALLLHLARSRDLRALIRDVALVSPGFLLCVSVYWWFGSNYGWNRVFGESMGVLPNSHFAGYVKNWSEQHGLTLSPPVLLRSIAIAAGGTGLVVALTWWAVRSRRARLGLFVGGLAICVIHLAASLAPLVLHRTAPSILLRVAPVLFFNRGMLWCSFGLMIAAALQWRNNSANGRESATLLLALTAFLAGLRALNRIEPMGYPIFFDTLAYLVWIVAIVRLAGTWGKKPPDAVWKGFAILLCCGMIALTAVQYPVHLRQYAVRSPRGTVYTSRVFGEAFGETLDFLKNARARGEKFVVMPEDTALYFLSEASAPTRWYLMLPLVLPSGAPVQEVERDIDRAAVKYVVLSNRATPEYGAPVFGADYLQDLYRWVIENFRPVKQIGNYERVSSPKEWGVTIYERKSGDGARGD